LPRQDLITTHRVAAKPTPSLPVASCLSAPHQPSPKAEH
jgi:hypothetical protein